MKSLTLMTLSLLASAAHADPTTSFNGIAALPNCSGALFRFAGQGMDDPALVLTNGHCIGMLGPYEVIVEEPWSTEITIFDANDAPASTWNTTEIVYGTMFDTDMAIVRLDATYQEILDTDGADPLWLSDTHPEVGTEIAITSGYWEYITTCAIDGFVPAMQEGDWTWTDSVRFGQDCVTFGGTSGSPVIAIESGEIIAVNNTGYEGGEPCSVNNPCEIDAEGNIRVETDGAYGQQTYKLYGCVDEAFQLDLDLPSCALPVPRGVLGLASVDWSMGDECDGDGALDASETAILTIEVANDGPIALTEGSLELSASTAALSFPDGATQDLPTLAPWSSTWVDVPVALAEGVAAREDLTVEITVTDPTSARPEVSLAEVRRVQFDVLPNSSDLDDVEGGDAGWQTEAEIDGDGWEGWRREEVDGSTVWHADDLGTFSDLTLVSPALEVGQTDFTVQFEHRYAFESSDGLNWDGGLVEISLDGGDSWEDVRDHADVDYDGTITTESGNPLGGRRAFVGTSADWPKLEPVTLDFGTALAGQTAHLRFRLGSDPAVGGEGWDIDNIHVVGTTALPFSTLVDHDPSCGATSPTDENPGDRANPTASAAGGCACDSGSARGGWLGLLLLLGLVRGRRH